jgi:hypothetical protein
MVTEQSGDQNLLQINFHNLKPVDHFISFSKSPKSSKSEFGAKSYAQNTKGWCCWNGHVAGSGDATCKGWRCHRPRVYSAHRKGRCHPLGWAACWPQFGCIFRPSSNTNLLFSSPFLLQLHQVNPNQLQQVLLCKCTNTTKYSPSCAYVLAFHKHFPKG